jgi:hypothetical protein
MKKTITMMLLIISIGATAQTYFGASATGKGIEINAGTIVKKIDVGLQYRFSPTQNYGVVSASIGKQITFYAGDNEDDNEDFNFCIIPSIGVAQHFATYTGFYKGVETKSNYTTAAYKIEAQLSSRIGHRLKYVAAYSYVGADKFLSIGFKGYLKK